MRTQPEKQLNMDNYKITERKGHHQPNTQGYGHNCGCEEETQGGYAYRDKVAESTSHKQTRWDKIRFYHQAQVVKKNGDLIEVDTHGHGLNSTTRERINKELEQGFKIVQRDYEVKLKLPNGDLLELPTEKFQIDFVNNQVLSSSGDTLVEFVEA